MKPTNLRLEHYSCGWLCLVLGLLMGSLLAAPQDGYGQVLSFPVPAPKKPETPKLPARPASLVQFSSAAFGLKSFLIENEGAAPFGPASRGVIVSATASASILGLPLQVKGFLGFGEGLGKQQLSGIEVSYAQDVQKANFFKGLSLDAFKAEQNLQRLGFPQDLIAQGPALDEYKDLLAQKARLPSLPGVGTNLPALPRLPDLPGNTLPRLGPDSLPNLGMGITDSLGLNAMPSLNAERATDSLTNRLNALYASFPGGKEQLLRDYTLRDSLLEANPSMADLYSRSRSLRKAAEAYKPGRWAGFGGGNRISLGLTSLSWDMLGIRSMPFNGIFIRQTKGSFAVEACLGKRLKQLAPAGGPVTEGGGLRLQKISAGGRLVTSAYAGYFTPSLADTTRILETGMPAGVLLFPQHYASVVAGLSQESQIGKSARLELNLVRSVSGQGLTPFGGHSVVDYLVSGRAARAAGYLSGMAGGIRFRMALSKGLTLEAQHTSTAPTYFSIGNPYQRIGWHETQATLLMRFARNRVTIGPRAGLSGDLKQPEAGGSRRLYLATGAVLSITGTKLAWQTNATGFIQLAGAQKRLIPQVTSRLTFDHLVRMRECRQELVAEAFTRSYRTPDSTGDATSQSLTYNSSIRLDRTSFEASLSAHAERALSQEARYLGYGLSVRQILGPFNASATAKWLQGKGNAGVQNYGLSLSARISPKIMLQLDGQKVRYCNSPIPALSDTRPHTFSQTRITAEFTIKL